MVVMGYKSISTPWRPDEQLAIRYHTPSVASYVSQMNCMLGVMKIHIDEPNHRN